MANQDHIQAPRPLRNKLLAALAPGENGRIPRSSSSANLSSVAREFPSITSKTPDPTSFAYDKGEDLINERLRRYNLDYPENYDIYLKNALDENSKWFSRKTKRKLNLVKLLPYDTETHLDHAKYLTHILVHLYIAIKSMDLEGSVSISTKDLASIRNDVELALDTDFFSADLSHDIESFQADDDEDDEGDEEDNEVRSSGFIGKVMPRSATVISVNHWTNELKSCLKMKVDLPLRLRAALAKVYYYLALSVGQSIHGELFISMFIKLTIKFRKSLIKDDTLSLDHKPLMEYLNLFFYDPNPEYDIYHPRGSQADKAAMESYTKFGRSANMFFSDESMREIFDWSLERFSLSTSTLSTSVLLSCLPIRFTEIESALDYLPSIFQLLSSNTLLKLVDLNLIELLGRISQNYYEEIRNGDLEVSNIGDYGIFTESQFNFILNKVQTNLRLEFKINSFEGISLILTYSLTSKNFEIIMPKLNSLLSSLETFVHPSNLGAWTPLIARFCQKFLTKYHKRFIDEQNDEITDLNLQLNNEMNTIVFKSFKDLVLLGSQSKKESASNYYISAIGVLCDLPTNSKHELINQILLDLYDSLTDQYVNSNHRLIVSLKQFTTISRYMVEDELYRVHITNILSLLMNKIGTNDLMLTNEVFNSLVTIVSFIQFHDFSSENDYISFESNTLNLIQEHLYSIKQDPSFQFQPDRESLNQAFIASTKIFKDLVKTLIDKYILLLSADLNDKLMFKFSQTLMILVQSLSEDIFKYLVNVVREKFLDETLNPEKENETLTANTVAIVIKRDPKLSVEFFHILDRLIRTEIDENGAGTARSSSGVILGGDKKLVMYLIVISEVLSVSLNEVLNIRNEVLNLFLYLFDNITNPSLISSSTYALHKTLKNLTNVKLRENRVFQIEPPNEDIDSRWGLHQFDTENLKEENLMFDWYIPSSKEVSFAVEIFETIVYRTITKIDSIIATGKLADLSERDVLTKSLTYLAHSLSGLSILIDPEFNSESFDNEVTQNSLQRRLMILKSLRESKGEDNEMNMDIDTEIKSHPNLDSLSIPSPSKEHNEEGMVKLDAEQTIDNINADQITVEGDDDKAMSSRALSPALLYDPDSTSVMNPTIAFRELKLYNCNYFFGRTQAEKRRNQNYGHVHSLRSLIGHSLHKLAVVLADSKQDNVVLTQNVLLTIRSYFCDVGKESSFDVDDQLYIDYTFIKKVQILSNHKKPFTRVALGARLEKFHRQRVILHSTNRFQSKLDKILLKDLVHLATSPFPDIYQRAQIILVESMEKLIGSYGLIINELLGKLEHFISIEDFKSIGAGLRILKLKTVFKKISHDYSHIKRIMEVFGNCLRVKDDEVNLLAQGCISGFYSAVKIPSEVAIFDESSIDLALRPTDQHIDLEISTVKSAKDKKRKHYYEQIDDLLTFLIKEEASFEHWKYSLYYLKYIVNLQEFYEFPCRREVLHLLIERSKTEHPYLIRYCIKAFSKLVERVFHFASFDHDLKNSFSIGYNRNELVTIDSTQNNFNQMFKSEGVNFDNPKFFIDNMVSSGFLFWGKTLSALTVSDYDTRLNKQDLDTLQPGLLITKDLLKQIFLSLAQENETNGNFQEAEVALIVSVVRLASLGQASIKYVEILELVSEIYNKDDKASVIVVAEIVAGLLEGSKYCKDEDLKLRDTFLEKFFQDALLSDLSTDSAKVWLVLFWIVPSKMDFKRIPIIMKFVENLSAIVDPDSNLAFAQSSRISFTTAFLTISNYRYSNYEKFLSVPFDHPYHTVRKQIANLLATLPLTFIDKGYSNSTEFLKASSVSDIGAFSFEYTEKYRNVIIKLFDRINLENTKVQALPTQDALKSEYFYLASTVLSWIFDVSYGACSPGLTPYIKDYISPFLIQLENNRELCKLGNLNPDAVYQRIASIVFRNDQIPDLISTITTPYYKNHQILMQLSFTEKFFSNNMFLLSSMQKSIILEHINELLFHSSIEVRVKSSSVFSGIIHNSKDLSLVQSFIDKYQKFLNKRVTSDDITAKKTIKLHGSVLGIGALVSAYPYISPPPEWLIKNVALLARISSMKGVVGKTAKDFLSDFKKIRADTWHIDRTSFTEEQLEDLEGVLWRSYFA